MSDQLTPKQMDMLRFAADTTNGRISAVSASSRQVCKLLEAKGLMEFRGRGVYEITHAGRKAVGRD